MTNNRYEGHRCEDMITILADAIGLELAECGTCGVGGPHGTVELCEMVEAAYLAVVTAKEFAERQASCSSGEARSLTQELEATRKKHAGSWTDSQFLIGAARAERDMARADAAELTAELARTKEERDTSRTDAMALGRRLNEAKSSLAAMRTERDMARAVVKALKADNDRLFRSRSAAYTRAFELANGDVYADLSRELAELKGELSRVRVSRTQKQGQRDDAWSSLSLAKSERDTARAEIDRLESKLRGVTTWRDRARERSAPMETNASLTREVTKLKALVEELVASRSKLKAKLDASDCGVWHKWADEQPDKARRVLHVSGQKEERCHYSPLLGEWVLSSKIGTVRLGIASNWCYLPEPPPC